MTLRPQHPGNQRIFNAPPGTVWLCGILIACYGLYRLAPPEGQEWAIRTFAFIPVLFHAMFAEGGTGISLGGLLPLAGHVLFHADLIHLLVNVGLLLAFGSVVERTLGLVRFLTIFFVSATGGAIAQALAVGPVFMIVIGASGAIYGVIGAAVRFMLAGSRGGGTHPVLIFVAVIMGINILLAILGMGGLVAAAAIAWQAHIGGFVAGLLLAYILAR